MDIDENPFTGPLLHNAFDEGWNMEQDYEILRNAYRISNNENI